MKHDRSAGAWLEALAQAFCLELTDSAEADRSLYELEVLQDIFASKDLQTLRQQLTGQASAAELFGQAWTGRLTGLTQNLACLFAASDRNEYFPVFVRRVGQIRQARGFERVTLSSVEPVSTDEQHRIQIALEKKYAARVDLKTVIDPSLLAGFRLDGQSWSYDASLRNRLEQLRENLIDIS